MSILTFRDRKEGFLYKEKLKSKYLQNKPVGVEIIDLYKSYGDNHVLRGLNLEVRAGETLVVIGKSGIGKSVLLRHIIGLEEPDSGRILIEDMEVGSPEINHKFRITMVFQASALFNSLSVGENVSLWLKEHKICPENKIKGIVAEKLAMVGLEGKEDIMPGELSGGMKKRVAIARALAMNPDLILFDEPTSELDPLTAHTIGEVIVDLKEKVEVTQIIVTHDVMLAFYIADRIAALHNGKIIESGSPEDIRRSKNPMIREFIKTPFKEVEGGIGT